MKRFVKPLLVVVVFALMQGLASVVMGIWLNMTTPEYTDMVLKAAEGLATQEDVVASIPPTTLALSVIVSGILSVLICWLAIKAIRMKQTFCVCTLDWRMGIVGILGALAGIISSDFLSEQFNLPNLLEEAMLGMSQNVLGVLSIALIGPVVEELLFREGIIGTMLQHKFNPWVAIVMSALLFGIIHANPAQIPFAAIIGILLGIVYYKTGNIVLTSIIHILNNSMAIVEMNILGEKSKDMSYSQLVGGNVNAWIIIAVTAIVCIALMMKFWKQYVPVTKETSVV